MPSVKKRRKKKNGLNKTGLLLHLDHPQMVELKRALFRNGLTAHQFFAYVVQQISVSDSRLEEILEEAKEYKRQQIIDGKVERVDPETLYRMIEETNKNNQSEAL